MSKALYHLSIICCLFLLPSSVSAQECAELKIANDNLKRENQSLKEEKRKREQELIRSKSAVDSISNLVSLFKWSPNGILTLKIDSLKGEIAHRDKRLTGCQNEKQQLNKSKSQLTESLEQLRGKLRVFYSHPGNEAKQITYNNATYDCYTVDVRQSDIQFYWKDEKGKPLLSLAHLAQTTERDSNTLLIFGTNAGMYLSNNSPQGLFVQQGKELVPIDRQRKESGNFYLQPNGVFFITQDSVPRILTTEQFTDDLVSKTRFATQSGPMVVINGEINKKFKVGSDNLNIRSGVGILDKNRVVFVISNQQVNFYDFASVFKEKLKCQQALYLDGAISEMYLPEVGRLDDGGNFGPIIGITKKR